MSFSHASVIETVQLNPRLRRITLRVDDPESLDVQRAGDSAVGVYFPTAEPASGAEGRNYSVRRHDGDVIDLDVVLHARGPGTMWATSAAPGDRVGLDHARSWYRPEPITDWQLLVTDLSGLPATARIIEELPGGVPVTAIVEVADRDDLEYLPSHPDVTVVPSIGSGNGHAPSQLAHLVRELTLSVGRGYCWFAGEASESRAVRKHLRARGWTIDQYDITGYWRFDSETWDQKFALVEDDVLPVYEKALADGKGDKVASEEFDDALERVGL
ncbi:siderophore-interacting protein [Mycobacterium sp. URHB0044]|jgi:NADPH-dependent ferric siderophore reductase|uniref:siderophore-interacting protein n=1 Tax=Mycobacterium sp. URHB0044 TaxID=1380386 RepID=UPI00048FE4E7|nr:siderophore-interacting protein [Mycobacterium sp. URHB0044]